MNSYDVNKENILKYIKEGEKKDTLLTIGIEIEHIVVNKQNLASITYYQDKGIQYILEQLLLLGWERSSNDGDLLGINKNGDTITLEPGAQLEISIKNCVELNEIEERYFEFLKDVTPILEECNYELLCIGYHPVSKIEDIPFIPKERYKYMSDYLSKSGSMGLNMMKGTASLQVAVDYIDEDDYIKKNRVANYLSPFISFIFDNTPIFEGELWNKNLARVNVWNNVDADRCMIVPKVLDKKFDYNDYAEYILNRPCIIALIDGKFIYTKGQLVKDIYKQREMTLEEIEHVLTMFFPDVRTKKYIEIRMADSVPYPYNIAAGALWKGILYNKDQLEYFYQQSLGYSNEDISIIKNNLIAGNQTTIEDATIIIRQVLQRSNEGLNEKERKYLLPLIGLSNEYKNLKHRIDINSKGSMYNSIMDFEINKHLIS